MGSPLIIREREGLQRIFITQDIRGMQLATLCEYPSPCAKQVNSKISKSLPSRRIRQLYHHDHAMEIGLLPVECRGKVITIGTAALTGAKMAIKSAGFMEAAERIPSKTGYIELSTRVDFQDLFVDNMEFKSE